jgi:O-acetylserine/cysteine efflux transporter
MRVRDALLATLTSVIWGLAFVAIKVGLEGFSAPQLTALRFLVACLPVFLVPRPAIPWSSLVLIGLTLFTGQFLLLFFAYTEGLPPGLASVTQQMQAFFTVLLAAVFLREFPSRVQCLGITVAFAGLVLIGSTLGSDLPVTGLGLGLAGAFSWAVGNVLVKRTTTAPIFPLVVWASLVPPLPAIALSAVYDRHASLLNAIANASWLTLAAAAYLGVAATVIAYALWGHLLQRYPAAVVAPFALLAPCTGVAASAAFFGETFSPIRFAGMALILSGLAVVARSAGHALRAGGSG